MKAANRVVHCCNNVMITPATLVNFAKGQVQLWERDQLKMMRTKIVDIMLDNRSQPHTSINAPFVGLLAYFKSQNVHI
ncbi:hypothetical protein M0R45_032777 [Rubus argutus]|uniref:Uncharacterized protein n=1 Tax=Rubus argutus TaxID=59490 RepID=A0AAW1WJQ8_RUBAR